MVPMVREYTNEEFMPLSLGSEGFTQWSVMQWLVHKCTDAI